MTKFIERAKEQFETFGKVIITTYNDRTYGQNDHVFTNLEEAIEFIIDFPVYAGEEEDIHVSNESSL